MLMIDFDEFISNCNDTPSNNEMDQLQKKLQEQARKIGKKNAFKIYNSFLKILAIYLDIRI